MKMKILIGMGISSLMSLIFYWFEFRPTLIRSSCEKETIDKVKNMSGATTETYELAYKMCVRSKGLNE